MCVSIVDSSTYQCDFSNHSVVRSVNKIQILSFFTKDNRILSRKKILLFTLAVIACFVTDWSKFISIQNMYMY